jgi:methionine sulfoxide reductase heme-binding subunit
VALVEKLLRSKTFVVTLIVLPGLWPVWPMLIEGNPTTLADPTKYLLHHFGFVAAVLLVVVLALSPLRVLFPKSKLALALNRHRRLAGVSVFVYAVLHLTLHILHEGGFSTFAKDIEKPFILTGMAAFVILLALAATSINAAVRWLGGKRWKNLHRLVYLAALLATYHQAASHKVFSLPVLFWFLVPIGILELLRFTREARKPQVMTSPAQRS